MKGKGKISIIFIMFLINIILIAPLVESQQPVNITESTLSAEAKKLLTSANILFINGTRFNDLNSNGIIDTGEKGLEGAIIRLMQNGTEVSAKITNKYGRYFFNNLTPGQYTIFEEQVNDWNQTSPPGGSYNVTLTDTPLQHLDFADIGAITTTGPFTVMQKSTMNLSNDWVLTPFGPRLRSKVHQLEQNDTIRMVNGSFQVISSSGEVKGNFVANTSSGANASLISSNVSFPQGQSVWVANTGWHKNTVDPIDSFTTTWIVPPAPTTTSGQTIFLFNGIQDSVPHILQPVLQWGTSASGGGDYWSVASWYVGGLPTDEAYTTPPVRVNPGDTLVGIMTRTGSSSTGHSYICQFQGIPETWLNLLDVPELTWFCETLEAWDVKSHLDYPATDVTIFQAIGIQAGSQHPTVEWTPDKTLTDCGRQHAEVVSNANPGGEVDIYYGRDSFGYMVTDSSYPDGPRYDWIEISGDGTEILPNSDDPYVSNIPLGFFFNFYGTDYSQLAISNNGLLFSGVGSSKFVNDPIKQSPFVHGFIAPFWDDLVTWGSAGSVYYKTIGTEPNRKFVVEWKDNQHYHDSTEGITFEAILYEGSNNIQYQYLDTTFGTVTGSTSSDLPPYDFGGSATVGIESPDGNDGLQYSYNDQVTDPELAILYKFPQTEGTNLYLSKQAPASKDHGSTMVYTIHYQNFGDTAALNVVLEDTLPAEVEYISSSDGGSYDPSTRKVTWNIGSIAPIGHGYRTVTVSIPESVAIDTLIQNDATISTSNIEVRYDDNEAHAQTTVTGSNLPPNVGVEPNLGGTTPSVYWNTPITFSYHNPTATCVDIRIHLDDGGTDITGSMINGPPDWTYTTTFYPRTGHATVTYTICGGTPISFDIYIDPAGYIYNVATGERIEGASVWLQRPDGTGDWENVPTGQTPPIMQPDENPLITGIEGQYQWDVLEGSYRVHVEAPGYYPSDSVTVSIPPPVTDLHVGLAAVAAPPNTPTIPSGPSSSWQGCCNSYSTSTTDPNGDQVKYTFDWGDDTPQSQTDLTDSGTSSSATHTWSAVGTYQVKVMATDINGATSEWSDPLLVTIQLNKLPNAPDKPSGSAKGYAGALYRYSTSAKDPDKDKVKYTFNWGDSTTSDTSLVKSGTRASASHTWSTAGTYQVMATATDSKGASSGLSRALTVKIAANNPPSTPNAPSGPSSGKIKKSYTYKASAADLDGDKVKYSFDWGDGTTSTTSLVKSGVSASKSHAWRKSGTYQVKVKATDSKGAPSGWSDTLAVIVA